MTIDLFMAEEALANYLNYKGDQIGLPYIEWLVPSESESQHQPFSGDIIVSLQPNQLTNNAAQEQLNYDLTGLVTMTVRDTERYVARQNAAKYYKWLWETIRRLHFTGAIASDNELSQELWGGGAIISSQRQRAYLTNTEYPRTFISEFNIEYHSHTLDKIE